MKNTVNTNSKEFKAIIKAYILNAIDGTTHGKEFASDADKINFVYNCFESEYYSWRKKENKQNVFAEWLQGLPSCFNVDFENYRIIELAKQWGTLPVDATEKQENKILSNWFNFIAFKFLQIHYNLK